MSKYTVLIPDRLDTCEVEEQVLGDNYNIIMSQAVSADEISDEVWGSADAVIAWHEIEFSREVIEKLSKCRVISRCGVGYDNIDLKAAAEKGIVVNNVPDYGTADVADHAMSLMLTLARNLPAYNRVVEKGDWTWEAGIEARRLSELKLGIIGLGRIGTAVSLRAKAFGMNVCFYDPYVEDGKDKALGLYRYEKLEDMLRDADIVSFHCPLTGETEGMGDDSFFESLKKDAIVINTARGRIIDGNALFRGMKSGIVKACGLDVFETEPVDRNHPLIKSWLQKEEWVENRLVITPHAAFFCREAYEELRRKAAEEVARFFRDKSVRNCVNSEFLKKRD